MKIHIVEIVVGGGAGETTSFFLFDSLKAAKKFLEEKFEETKKEVVEGKSLGGDWASWSLNTQILNSGEQKSDPERIHYIEYSYRGSVRIDGENHPLPR